MRIDRTGHQEIDIRDECVDSHGADHRAQGRGYEKYAADYLQARGLRLITRNFQCRGGEIDLIMSDNQSLVFVEVRYRRSSRFGSPAESVDFRKQRKLRHCALNFMQQHGFARKRSCRFDVVAITPRTPGPGLDVNWIVDAFQSVR
ncbi:MAG: YraN family protein [Pseudohongiellaceae bacterium]